MWKLTKITFNVNRGNLLAPGIGPVPQKYVESDDEDGEDMDITIKAWSNSDLHPDLLDALPTDQGTMLESFMNDLGPEWRRGIATLKNVHNVTLGDDQTKIASRATTIAKNAEVGIDDDAWHEELFEDRDFIGIEFDKSIDPGCRPS